jgi:hypothetical protein
MRVKYVAALCVAAIGGAAAAQVPAAHANPDPRVEYLYDVSVRRQYTFPGNTDAVSYGFGICQKVTGGESYAAVVGDVKNDTASSDEYAASYLVSNAVNFLCPEQIWQLRKSAANYQLH